MSSLVGSNTVFNSTLADFSPQTTGASSPLARVSAFSGRAVAWLAALEAEISVALVIAPFAAAAMAYLAA
jgi:hypothetical protein